MGIELLNKVDPNVVANAKKYKIYQIPIDQLIENPENGVFDKDNTDEAKRELRNSILETGLQEPLIATKCEEDYVLMSGHRRLSVIKELLGEGKTVLFNGEPITRDKCPVILKEGYKSDMEMYNALVASNVHRKLSQETLRTIALKKKAIYDSRREQGEEFDGRIRDKIAEEMHLSGRTVGRYLREEKKELSSEEAIIESFTKTKKTIEKATKFVQSVDTSHYGLGQTDVIKHLMECLVEEINASIQKM